jgi:hypothetical protein
MFLKSIEKNLLKHIFSLEIKTVFIIKFASQIKLSEFKVYKVTSFCIEGAIHAKIYSWYEKSIKNENHNSELDLARLLLTIHIFQRN